MGILSTVVDLILEIFYTLRKITVIEFYLVTYCDHALRLVLQLKIVIIN